MSIADEQRVSASGATTAQSASQPDAYSPQVIRKLNDLTSDFYAREATSFSATRQAPWHGWEKAWDVIATHNSDTEPLAVLDLGCGNLRFERFLAERTSAPVHVIALDNCPELAVPENGLPERLTVNLQTLDLVEALLDGTFADRLPRGECDLAVAFGLMHHLPTFALRARILEGLLGSLKPGGFAVVSFWQLLNDPRLAAKAATATAEGRAAHHLAAFQENDFLLGWQQAEGVYRFCHHAPEAEIDALLDAIRKPSTPSTSGCASAAPLPFREIACFSADGKLGNLNRYLILQRL